MLTSAAAAALLGATLAPAQAQFVRLFGFGDSYADTGSAPGGAYRLIGATGSGPIVFNGVPLTTSNFWPCPFPTYTSCRFTGSTNFVDSLQSIYGLPGLTNFSIGGARTSNSNTMPFLTGDYGLPYELNQFVASGIRFTDRDLIALSIGGNDLSGINVFGSNDPNVQTPIVVASAVSSAQAAVGGVQQLVGAGARTIAWLGTGSSKWFPERTLGVGDINFSDPVRDAWSDTYYRQTQLLLTPLAQAGVRIFMFNFGILQQRIYDNPAMYGFASIPAGYFGCEAGPGTASTPTIGPYKVALNVTGCFYENSVHPTGPAMALIANYMANQINAPTTVAPQAGISTGLLTGFSTSVFDRLEAGRRFQPYGLGAAMAAMPGKAAAPKDPADHWSVFGDVSYAGGGRDQQFYTAGYDYNAAGGYLGAEYRLDSNWRVGGVFGYSQPDVKLAIQDARNRIDAFQFAGYSSYVDAHWFADGLVGYGRHNYDLERRGIIDVIRANTHADLFTVAARGGYLFDAGKLRVGPIASLQYSYATIKGYTEAGDVLLTMMVDRQTREALTGDAGVQFRYPLQLGNGIYTPFVNLTAAHDFLDGHTLTTTLVSAPLLPILTPVSVDGSTYGRVAAGVSALVADKVSATLTGTTSFARHGGNDAAVSGGLKVAF